jgi:hypothetical protein
MRLTLCLSAAAAIWIGAVVSALSGRASGQAAKDVPTFTRDVAPILYRHCTSCHRPGEIAPMSLLTFADARPWAAAIRDEVGDGRMPPWHAEAPRGTFLHERRLSSDEKSTLLKWASGGAPEGDPKDLPAAPVYTEGWTIGKPDVVFAMAEAYSVPADGIVNYEHFYIATNFTEVTWVKAVEVRPGSRGVVHHVLAYYRAAPDLARTPIMSPLDPSHSQLPAGSGPPGRHPAQPGAKRLLASYAPGTNAQVMPAGTALRLEPGGIIELQIHYSTNGEPASDRTSVGLVFAKGSTPPREVLASAFLNGAFTLPAGRANVAVETGVVFLQDVTVWGLFPHTHLRGKKWKYVAELPDGTRQTVLDVPRYDFNWQTYYVFKEPLQLPRGTRLYGTAWYDNSAGNKSNPDPKADVKWGDQVWEEMQYTGILVSPVQAPKARL